MFNRRRLAVLASLLMLAAGLSILAYIFSGAEKPARQTLPEPEAFVAPTSVPAAPTAEPEAQPTPVPSDAFAARLVIPKINVDARVQVLGVDRNGAMQDPKGPVDVGWYNLSLGDSRFSYPGWGGNAVFAGHVDYVNYGPAVFYHLRDLKPDDQVEVDLADGTQYFYRVTSLEILGENQNGLYSVTTGQPVEIADVVGNVGREVITLITCQGTFNPKTREYDKRLIVRADRYQPA